MNYGEVYSAVDDLMQTRSGLNNPKQKNDYQVFVREVTGILCGVAHQHNISMRDVTDFTCLVKYHKIKGINTWGEMNPVSDLIDEDIRMNPMYDKSEHALMSYKPGKTQVGPGEFFFCMFDRHSTFGIDNQAGYDVVVDGKSTELKKLGSNFTDKELFDHYQASDKVERLMVVKPVSDAVSPLIRSHYSCIQFDETHWSEIYEHRGKNGSLYLVGQ